MNSTLAAMEKLYSRKYGLINTLEVNTTKCLNVSRTDGTFTLGNVIPMYRPIAMRNKRSEKQSGTADGSSASLNPVKAKIKSIGEYIERFSSTYTQGEGHDGLIFDSYDNLTAKGVPCLDFSKLLHLEDSLYENSIGFSKYSIYHSISWIKGRDLINDSDIWLPAQKVFIKYPYDYPEKEKLYVWGLSTGLACGSNYEQAALSAIFEVVERDSFMLTWKLQLSGVRIEMDSITNEDLRELYSHIKKYMVGEDELFIYDISKTEGVHTVLTFFRNNLPDAYGIIVSAASNTDIEIALLKSLEELCQSQAFAYSTIMTDDTIKHLHIEDVNSLHKHFFYYSTCRHNGNINFISASNKSVLLSKLRKESSSTHGFNHVINLFRKNNQSLYISDVTKPEIEGIGFKVLKAIIPDYLDLDIDYNLRQLKYNRLKMFQEMNSAKLNNNPHPFP